MEIIWTMLEYNLADYQTIRIPLQEKRGRFWNSRKPIRAWVGKFRKDLMQPRLIGKIIRDGKVLLVNLYLLPRGKFNLILGTATTSGAQYESALVFTEQGFGLTTSRPSQIKKAVKNHIKDIEAEVDKRFNGEWLYMNEEEKKKIVWEDRAW